MALSHLCPVDSVHKSTWTLLERPGEAQDTLMGPEHTHLTMTRTVKQEGHGSLPPASGSAGRPRLPDAGHPHRVTPAGSPARSPAPAQDNLWSARLRHARELGQKYNSPAGLGATLAYGTSMNDLATLWKKIAALLSTKHRSPWDTLLTHRHGI